MYAVQFQASCTRLSEPMSLTCNKKKHDEHVTNVTNIIPEPLPLSATQSNLEKAHQRAIFWDRALRTVNRLVRSFRSKL